MIIEKNSKIVSIRKWHSFQIIAIISFHFLFFFQIIAIIKSSTILFISFNYLLSIYINHN